MEADDIVDPGDAAIQALLALAAQNTNHHVKRVKLIDAILTLPPLTEWSPDCREHMVETCQFIRGLRRRAENCYGSDD